MLLGVNAKFARSCRSVNASGRQPWKNIDGRFNFRVDDTMKTKPLVLSICLALLSFAFASSASETDTKALRDLDAQWSAAAGAKDLDKTVAYYSDDAIVMPPNAPSATTKEAIRSVLFASPGLVISWKTTKIEVAQSGDLACLSGTYELTMNDASGKSVNDHGKYVEVWEKQSDGKWKCGTDIWNSDLPAPGDKK